MARKITCDIERIRICYINHRPKAYENRQFVPIFQDAAAAIATTENLTGVDLKLLFYIIANLKHKK